MDKTYIKRQITLYGLGLKINEDIKNRIEYLSMFKYLNKRNYRHYNFNGYMLSYYTEDILFYHILDKILWIKYTDDSRINNDIALYIISILIEKKFNFKIERVYVDKLKLFLKE